MNEFKLKHKQIREEKVGTCPSRALVELKESNMETRLLVKENNL
jgi:hypothetical protein